MKVNLIVAGHYIANNVYGIGIDNKLPWHCPTDMRFFRKTTIGNKKNAVIVGRVTYDGINEKYKPFIDRLNIVMTNQTIVSDKPNLIYVNNWEQAMEACKERDIEEVFIAGGQEIYKSAFKSVHIHNIYLTEIQSSKATAFDTFFVLPSDFVMMNHRTENLVDFFVYKNSEDMTEENIL